MKSINKQKHVKQITYIVIILMLCNFIFPNYNYAVSTEGGGSLLNSIAQFLCFIPDAVNNFLQNMFVTPQKIEVLQGRYEILYSPGIIFSGEVPAFNINFINPMEKKETRPAISRYISLEDITTGDIGNVFNRLKENRIKSDGYYSIWHWADSLDNEYEKICNKYNYDNRDYQGQVSYGVINYDDWYKDNGVINSHKQNSFWICGNTLYFMVFYTMDFIVYYDVAYAVFETTLTDTELQEFQDSAKVLTSNVNDYKESSSAILQPIVATWYNALRRIALVGLLSVLVYIGIRILLSSTSAKDKVKYKNMLKDWLVALCLLFVLHYIMSITITVVDKINEVIQASTISANGEDILMTTVRNEIANSDNWSVAIAYVVIYCVLTVYTIIFTIQYIRRVIYLAFLTAIAPLITLTYPLDKIKDSKSQAFDMWLKDYIFFSLIQVLHLLLYYIFLGSAMDLANKGNWIYAIVAIGFLTKAEKIMKKMFGFEKSKSMGALAAGATGALIMNAINKIPHGSGAKGSKGQGGAQEGAPKAVRTATTKPLAALTMPGGGSSGSGGSSGGSSSGSGSSRSGSSGSGSSRSGSSGSGSSGSGLSRSGSSGRGGTSTTGRNLITPKRDIVGGITALGKRYVGPALGKVAGGFLGGAGAIIGFSAGIAQGDLKSAFAGAMAGGTAGYGLGQRGVNAVTNIKNPGEKIDEFTDTWKEGAYGTEAAQNAKFDREFRKSEAYSTLKRENPSSFSDQNIQKMLDAGITDPKKMDKILKKNAKNSRKYSIDKAIAYSTMAEKCPEDILYNNSKFIRFCQDRNIMISHADIQEMRKNIIEFK